ncbi:ABC transporter substrate-binding protein [bacterium]|nr:ABC transporter substrate-binding protein [bacterium]
MIKHLTAFLTLVLALAAFAGCPAPPKDTGDSGATGAQTDTNTASSARPSEYRWPLPADARSLDPLTVTDTVSDTVARRMFNGLVRFTPEGKVTGDAAEKWEISPDGLVYTFTLRSRDGQPALKFHNGEPLDSAAFLFSFKRVLDPANACERANLLEYVKGSADFAAGKTPEVAGLEAVDPLTFRITLDKPYTPFLNALCLMSLCAVPPQAVQEAGAGFGDKPVGSGPYKFDSWEREQRIVLKANPDYFDGQPPIETLVFRIIKDENTRFEEFKAGSLEHCDIPPSKISEVNADPKLKAMIQGVPAMDKYGYAFNCEEAPFKDNTALRQAFNYAVDKQNIVNNIWGGLVTEARTYVPEGMFYYWADSPGYAYDVEKAKGLLEQAGYPGGQGLPELVLNVDLAPTNKLVAEAVQEDLSKIGVKVRIETTDWGPFLDKIYAGESLFHQSTWLTDYPDPDNWLWQLLDSSNFGGKGNTSRWSNSEFDSFVRQAQVELDEARRAELYGKAERIAFDEAPWLLLYWKNSSTLVQPYVEGLTVTRFDRTPQLGGSWAEKVSLK